MIKEFLADDSAWDMFVTGPAGTGKTTSMRKEVEYCIENNISYVVCAHTHKACGILRSKLPPGARVHTLHSFLSKRPTINSEAIKITEVKRSVQTKKVTDAPRILFLDEFSMVGEKDVADIRLAQDPMYTGIPIMKLVAYGDLNQLPPVNDNQYLKPGGKYWTKLTKIYRNDNGLQKPLNKLIAYINEEQEPEPLQPVPGFFERGHNIDKLKFSNNDDVVYLAYTNRRVQDLNAKIQGFTNVSPGDRVFSPTTQQYYEYEIDIEHTSVEQIDLHYTDPLQLGSKYKTLEGLIASNNCSFGVFIDEEGEVKTLAYVFGHYNYKIIRDQLEYEAVESNKAIENEFTGYKAVSWARANPTHRLARARAKAWRNFLSFNDCVVCIDFTHAMTVHKSQGSTFHTVVLDTDDIAMVANRNFKMYLRLLYVGISRASHKVITP